MERNVLYDLHVELPWEVARRVFTERASTLLTGTDDGRLTVHVRSGGFDVARDVVVTTGAVRRVDRHAVALPVSWEAAEHPGRFPVTDGLVELSDMSDSPPLCALSFVGTVTSPFGVVGGIGDAIGGRRLADETMLAVLQGVADRLRVAVEQELAAQEHTTA